MKSPGRQAWRRLLVALGVVLLLVGSAASQAYADGLVDNLCKEVPKPKPPNWGMPGMLSPAKDLSTVPDQAPDPFAAGTTLRISDVYGWSAHYDVYDLGCGNSFLSDPAAVVNTNLANGTIEFEQTNLALLAGAEDIVKSDQLTTWLGDTLETIARGISPILWGSDGRPGWLGLALIAVGLIVVWSVRRLAYSDAARVLGVIVVAIALTAFALLMPAAMNRQLDQAVSSVAAMTSSTGIGTASPSDLINRESTYRTWLANNFGDADGRLANTQGPKLWAATHYSYSDMKAIAANADARGKIDEVKATQFREVAEEVKKTDPAAYERFTGRADRNGSAVLGSLTSGLMSLFQWISLIMIGVARLMMPALVVAAPFLALAGVLQVTRGHTALMSLWDMFTASILAVAKFGVASAVATLVMTAIYRSETLHPAWKAFLMIVLTVIGIMITKPIRTFKTMVPGLDPNKALLGGLNLGNLAGLLGTFVAAKAGVTAGIGDADGDETPSDAPSRDDADPKSLPFVHHDTPALPPPVFDQEQQQGSATTYSAHQVVSEATATPPEPAWRGVVASPVHAELPVGSRGALPPGKGADVDTDAGAAAAAGGPRPIEPSGTGGGGGLPRPEAEASENEVPTITPTGVYVDGADGGEYIKLEDPQLDADGIEHTEMNDAVVYHSPKAEVSASAGGAEIA